MNKQVADRHTAYATASESFFYRSGGRWLGEEMSVVAEAVNGLATHLTPLTSSPRQGYPFVPTTTTLTHTTKLSQYGFLGANRAISGMLVCSGDGGMALRPWREAG